MAALIYCSEESRRYAIFCFYSTTAMNDSLYRLQALIKGLPQGLQDHLYRTRDVALDLAERHGVDATKVELAALGHDILRAATGDRLLEQARSQGLAILPVEEQVPILLHGPLAAHKLREQCGITDPEVLEAVRWHSTACSGMGRVGLVVFLADKLDPYKVGGDPERTCVEDTARESLEEAAVHYLTAELASLLERGRLLHPASVKAWNDLLLRLAKGNPGR